MYSGVVLGQVSREEAYAPVLHKTFGRGFEERVHLLQLWMVPLLVFPARAVFPTEQVITSLETIHTVPLKTTSWGLTHDPPALPVKEGGMSLPDPKPFLPWQLSTPFTHSVMRPHTISSVARQCFTTWSQSVGLLVDIGSLEYFHMGSNIVWDTLPYLGLTARAFTLARHNLTPQRPAVAAYDMPLWDNGLLTNQHGQTCYCPAPTRGCVTTVEAFFGDCNNDDLLAPT